MWYLSVPTNSDGMECVHLNDVRNKHFVAFSIKNVFDNVEAQKITDFIKETRVISNFNINVCYLFFLF